MTTATAVKRQLSHRVRVENTRITSAKSADSLTQRLAVIGGLRNVFSIIWKKLAPPLNAFGPAISNRTLPRSANG